MGRLGERLLGIDEPAGTFVHTGQTNPCRSIVSVAGEPSFKEDAFALGRSNRCRPGCPFPGTDFRGHHGQGLFVSAKSFEMLPTIFKQSAFFDEQRRPLQIFFSFKYFTKRIDTVRGLVAFAVTQQSEALSVLVPSKGP